ncbi:MAG: hypothetical protein RLZZ436_1318 [Planctomycetota bacterium]
MAGNTNIQQVPSHSLLDPGPLWKAYRMARNESDREDLLQDAVALLPRAELRVQGQTELLTAGYRSGGLLSLYFGQDPVYQFDAAGRLRRAFVAGLLYRSEAVTISRLQKVRSEKAVTLLRHDLSPVELAEFRQHMQALLTTLHEALAGNAVTVARCVPEGHNWTALLLESLAKIAAADPWIAGPIVGRKAGSQSQTGR